VYPLKGLEANFCRNPSSSNTGIGAGIWCYITTGSGSSSTSRYEACDPLVKPDCTGIEDCYEPEFADGCCVEWTANAAFVSAAGATYGKANAVWGGKTPVAGNKFSGCMNKTYVDSYAGSLKTGTAMTVNNNDDLTKVFTAFGGFMNGAN
jgi:hypothetical protein